MPARHDLLDKGVGRASHRYAPFDRFLGSHHDLLATRV
jgi:hypothetical protein